MNRTVPQFSAAQFDRLFPFYFRLDADLRLCAWGPSVAKLVPLEAGTHFRQHFELIRPRHISLDRQGLLAICGQLVLISLSAAPSQLLRGQFETDANGDLIYLGSPWFSSAEAVTSYGLQLSDFAVFDPTIDLLYTVKTGELTRMDMQDVHRQLTANTQRLTQLVANLQSGVLVEDEHRHIVLVNQLFCNLFGIEAAPEAMVGIDCSQTAEQTQHLFTNAESFKARISTLLASRTLALNDRLELKDGRILERDYIPLFDNGQYLGHLWQYRDITEASKAQAALQWREEKYRSIIANMHLGLMEVDLDDRIRYVNQSFCDMSRYSSQDLLGQHATRLFVPKEQHHVLAQKNQIRTAGISDAYEVEIELRDGARRWWMISGAPLYNDAGVLIGSIGIHLDITEHKATTAALLEAKLQAEASALAKQQFLANMSHEIRTPMNAILGLSRQLQKKQGDAEQDMFVNTIVTAAENMLVILNDVLDFSKMEAGKLALEQVDFNLQAFVNKTLLLLGQKADEKGLLLEAWFDPKINPQLQGDPYRLNQILMNIIGNAIKFTEKGKVHLHCALQQEEADRQQLLFTVTDTGVGIDAAYLPHLFDKFSQQEQHSGRRFGGTGLGMSITYQLVKLMGGNIKVASTLGKGTEVQISLPFSRGLEAAPLVAATVVAPKELLSGKQVLLVDDNAMNRMVARIILKSLGMEITEAVNGAEAVAQVNKQKFALVLMDVQMPVMDGLEAARTIRNQLGNELPILALTANAIKGENEHCLAAGMNDYLAKPFSEQELVSKMCGLILNTDPADVVPPAPPAHPFNAFRELSNGDEDLYCELVNTWRSELLAAHRELSHIGIETAAIRRVLHRIGPGVELGQWPGMKEAAQALYEACHSNQDPTVPLAAFQHLLTTATHRADTPVLGN